MTQPTDHDYNVASGASGTTLRTSVNDYFEGVNTKSRGTTAPLTTFPGMDWIDSSATPEEWNIRNAANNAWNLFATIDASTGITILNQGAAVPGVGVANTFTENQTIDTTGSAGAMSVQSDRTTGIVASVNFGGHDDGGNDVVYGSIDGEAADDTDGSEDGQMVHRVMQGGSEVDRMTVGAIVDVNGIMDADTLRQGGTTVAQMIETEVSSVDLTNTTSATTRTVPTNTTAGDITPFEGASASTFTIDSGTAGEVHGILNDGTASITFVAGVGVTIVDSALSLAPEKLCWVVYKTATRVFIKGENT